MCELRKIVNEYEIENKINAALRYIETEANKVVSGLDTERPDDPIEFIIKDLTISIKNTSGRSDYLWEIGAIPCGTTPISCSSVSVWDMVQ